MVTVIVGRAFREASASTLAEDAAACALVSPELITRLWMEVATVEGQAMVVNPVGQPSQGTVIVEYFTGGPVTTLADALLVTAASILDAADCATPIPALLASDAIDEAAVAGHSMVLAPPGQASHGTLTMVNVI